MLWEEANEIQKFTDSPIGDDISEVERRGNRLNSYISRTGKMYADAREILNNAKKGDIIQSLERYVIQGDAPKMAINELVKSLCAKEQALVDWCGRLNSTCVHQLDWCRSLLSKYKEELRMNTFGGGGNEV